MERLELLFKKHEMGELPENKWLDPLMFRQIEKLQHSSLRSRIQAQQADARNLERQPTGSPTDRTVSKGEESDGGIFYLYIEFPRFDHPVVFADQEYPAPQFSDIQSSSTSDILLKPPPEVSYGPGIGGNGNPPDALTIGPLIRIYDPEVGPRENPVEIKHRRLLRSNRLGVVDRDLKPNAQMRDALNVRLSPLCKSSFADNM